MPNRRAYGVFAPEDIAVLQDALSRSMRALAFAFPGGPATPKARRVHMTLAKRIMQRAIEGEREPTVLSNDALAHLPPFEAAFRERARQKRRRRVSA